MDLSCLGRTIYARQILGAKLRDTSNTSGVPLTCSVEGHIRLIWCTCLKISKLRVNGLPTVIYVLSLVPRVLVHRVHLL